MAAATDVNQDSERLLTLVCACMVQEPKYYDATNERRTAIVETAQRLLADTEGSLFVLKLAVYARLKLNIRSTPNFLLAVAAHGGGRHPKWGPEYRRYFHAGVRLPTDCIQVVEMLAVLRSSPNPSLPHYLKAAVAAKFATFDTYSLGKYRAAVVGKKAVKAPKEGVVVVQGSMSLKTLIRTCHISRPAEVVLAVLGKKYPTTPEEFAKTGLEGEFDPARVGQRFKLTAPVTWDRELSESGNNAQTWSKLLESRSVPIMAMVKNLRNIINSGVREEVHQLVLGQFENEKVIAGSRQLPFAWLAAYNAVQQVKGSLGQFCCTQQAVEEVLKILKDKNEDPVPDREAVRQALVLSKQNVADAATVAPGRVNQTLNRRDARIAWGEHEHGKQQSKKDAAMALQPLKIKELELAPTPELVERYAKALCTAVTLSTSSAVAPVLGRTLIYVDASASMTMTKNSAKSKMSPFDAGCMLAMMLSYAAEESRVVVFGSPSGECPEGWRLVNALEPEDVLANVQKVKDTTTGLGKGTVFPVGHLKQCLAEEEAYDRVVVFSDMIMAPSPTAPREGTGASLDICFLLDTTGSMGSWIQASQEHIIQIIEQVKKVCGGPEVRVSFVGYKDHCDGKDRFAIHPFTKDVAAVKRTVQNQSASGGGDSPEDIHGAFRKALDLDWKARTRVAILIADAPCHGKKYHSCDDDYPEGDPEGLDMGDLIGEFVEKGINLSASRLGSETDKMMSELEALYDDKSCRRSLAYFPMTAEDFFDVMFETILTSVTDCTLGTDLQGAIAEYRAVHERFQYVAVDLDGAAEIDLEKHGEVHPNDIHIVGISDAVLRFINEPPSAQLHYVQTLDQHLKELQVS